MRISAVIFLSILTMIFAQQNRRGLTGTYGPRQQKPNIVLILTDDQDVELGSLNYMPKTMRGIKHQGAEFRHAYVTTPMCCPSRSSLLTGMYVHNHNVYTNNDNCSSTTWQTTYETRSFATYMSNAGYRTGYFGKYLNKYNGSYIPPGWREWGGLIMNSKYYNYSINMNGKKIKHGFDYSKDYYPDLIVNDSIAFLRQSKKNSAHKPVMLTMSFPSPHGPEDSAPQYSDMFFNVTSHHIPSYDYAPNPDKQWILQVTKKMLPIHKHFTDLLMTKRLQTLQSVDAAVQRVIEELSQLGELHNTYIIYTSDHGYHLGQFGLIKGKSFPFEFDVRVPFLVRGPGIEPGAIIDEIVLNIDLAPTFLDIAGVETPSHMDGRSILPLFSTGKRKRLKWPDTFLIESSGRRETPFLDAKLRRLSNMWNISVPFGTIKNVTKEKSNAFNNESTPSDNDSRTTPSSESEEGLDIDDDDDDDEGDDVTDDERDSPDLSEESQRVKSLHAEIQEEELTNQDRPPLKREQMQLDNRVLPGFIPLYSKMERLIKECGQPNMQKPCATHQKWFCEYENGRWRKHKCKSISSNVHPAMSRYRNCSCMTPHGLIHKKIPIDSLSKKNLRNSKRYRRHPHITQFSSGSDFDTLSWNFRTKRESLDQVDDVMRDLRGQLEDLQDTNTSMIDEQLRTRNLETNKIGGTISGCRIFGRGNVNCTNQVYQNKKAWQKSRHEVNNEIQSLKSKLEQLKEIRRHLKYYRPSTTLESDISSEVLDIFEEQSLSNHSRINSKKKSKTGNNTRKQHKLIKPRINVEYSTHSSSLGNISTPTSSLGNETNSEKHKPNKGNIQRHYASSTEKKAVDEIPYPISNCVCEPELYSAEPTREREITRNNKKRLDEEKMRRKARRQRKKENMDKQCSSERMNCFHHDNDHWKTEPLWTRGPFCFCMNSNNNTYSCVRTINATHNFLYCEFTTGLMTFYNLRIDPFELQNRFFQLKPEEKSFLHDQLKELIACKGKSCTVNQSVLSTKLRNIPQRAVTTGYHRYKKKRLFPENMDNGHQEHNGTFHNRHYQRLMSKNESTHANDKQMGLVVGRTRRKRKLIRERS